RCGTPTVLEVVAVAETRLMRRHRDLRALRIRCRMRIAAAVLAARAPLVESATQQARVVLFCFSSRRRHTRWPRDWSSDVCSSDLLEEAWRAHVKGSDDAARKAILETLLSVSLPAERSFLRRYSSQLSVGQAQRVIIAMAILHRPSLLIADEPTSALDTITQSEILRLFAQLSRELRMGILYISHDLLSVAALCHRIAILHAGQIPSIVR